MFVSSRSIDPYQQNLWLGIGCRQGITERTIDREVDRILQKYRLSKAEIAGVATIDLKAKEPAIIEYCQDNRFSLRIFSPLELERVTVSNPRSIVRDKTGTASVAEAAAILAASSNHRHAILVVPKQILPEDGAKIMTIAIARSIDGHN
jgi:cobalamin biosynthesis protein CbiG